MNSGMDETRRVLIVNPASGRGRAQRLDLVGHCRVRGIETVIRKIGEDISDLGDACDACS